MHPTAYDLGGMLFRRHWRPGYARILDIGALDVNGSLRDLQPAGATYVGIDLEAGKGVDMVLSDPYVYPFPDGHFDMIVSTSCFEHDPMFWLTFLEAARVLADGGVLYINAPSNGSYHTHPWDNWRFYPDASHALEMWGRRCGHAVHAVESFVMARCGPWNDYVMLFTKGDLTEYHPVFLTDEIPDATNIRRITHPDLVLRKVHDTDDMRQIAALAARVAELEGGGP